MLRPMVEYQSSGGVLVRYDPAGRHKPILMQVDRKDLRLVSGIGWVVTDPHKYAHIPEIGRIVRDMDKQMKMPL